MKFSQILIAVVSLIVALSAVSWYLQSAKTEVVENAEGLDEDLPLEDGELDYESSNPFDLEGEGPHPVAEADDTNYEFGRLALGETGHHAFVIRNRGDVPLKLARGPSQCKCTVSGLKQDEVAPGESVEIELEWTPKSMGPFHQEALIWTNDPENSSIAFGVTGDMFPKVRTDPERSWVLGTVPVDKPTPFEGTIISPIVEEFEITSVETTSDLVSVNVRPLTDEEKAELLARSGYQLEGVLAPDETAGKILERVTVHTDMEDHSEFVFEVSATRTGPFMIIGRGWYAGASLLDMGVVESKEGKTAKLTLMVEPFGEDLVFSDVVSNPPIVDVVLTKAKNSEKAKRHRYTLEFKVKPGSPVGIWTDQDPVKIKLKTNHPRVPVAEFAVEMRIP